MKYNLTKEEIEIENAAEKFVEFNDTEKNELDGIINTANLKKAITVYANCSVIYSEDLNGGQYYSGIKIVNPLT